MGAGTSAEEFFLKSINVESIFEFVESLFPHGFQYMPSISAPMLQF